MEEIEDESVIIIVDLSDESVEEYYQATKEECDAWWRIVSGQE